MDKNRLKQLLIADRSGNTAVQENRATQTVEQQSLELEVPVVPGIDPDMHSTVSAELEMSRSMNYNKVSVKVWASTPCKVGDEDRAMSALVTLLNKKAVEYVQSKSLPLLQDWSQGR